LSAVLETAQRHPLLGKFCFLWMVGEILREFLILLGKRAAWISWKLDEFSITVPDLSEWK
jgi:hypothetical protein